MKSRDAILSMLFKRGSLSSRDIAIALSITRQAAHHHLMELARTGRIIKVGRTNGSYYVLNEKKMLDKVLGSGLKKEGILMNSNLHEDEVFDEIRSTSQVLSGLRSNVMNAVQYAFTEMLNNAIEHSGSKKIAYIIKRQGRMIEFTVKDSGIGVFRNIMTKMHLANEAEAVRELLKGKGTTSPEEHNGKGIFFTSKVADRFLLGSSKIELCIDNVIRDVFVKERRQHKGTIVSFMLDTETDKKLEDIFKEYSNGSFVFDKSRVNIKLFTGDTEYISRSQAKKLLSNMEDFSKIILDFKGINTIGQGFADQIFRVFKNEHPDIDIEAENCSDMVKMMIEHVKGG